jgi:hypothetical protein
MSYARLWRGCGAGLVGLGVCWAAIVLPLAGAVVVLLVGGVFVALAGAAVDDDRSGAGPSWPSSRAWRRVAWGGPACLAFVGALATAPGPAFALLVVAGLSSPPAVTRFRAAAGVHPESTPPTPRTTPARPLQDPPRQDPTQDAPPTPPADEVRPLPDAVLWRVWTDSYWALRRAHSAQERIRLVDLRCRVLDEMERRQPLLMSEWLDGDARPQEGPHRFGRGAPGQQRRSYPDGEESAT